MNKKLSLSEAAKILNLTKGAIKQKALALGILHREEVFNHYYLYEEDLKHFQIDYRKKENKEKLKGE